MEKVDVGDKYPKQIASGLRAYYTQEEMQGRRILVVTNLKSAKLGGETSSGMVLCAKDGDKVVFVDPPADAKVCFSEVFCAALCRVVHCVVAMLLGGAAAACCGCDEFVVFNL